MLIFFMNYIVSELKYYIIHDFSGRSSSSLSTCTLDSTLHLTRIEANMDISEPHTQTHSTYVFLKKIMNS